MARILLVRHGQSEWNALGLWQGQADTLLSDLGRSQAQTAVESLKQLGDFDAVGSSMLQRAAETADIIATGLGMRVGFRTAFLNERDAGEWSGLSKSDIRTQFPGYLESGRKPNGYEPDEDFLVRIHRGLFLACEALDGNTLLMVAHGGLVYALEKAAGQEFEHLSNVEALWLNVQGGKVTVQERVQLLDSSDEATDLVL